MLRNEVIVKLISEIKQLPSKFKQDNLFFELESQQFINLIVECLNRFEGNMQLSEHNLTPLKNLLQARIIRLANSQANLVCNQRGAANIATLMLSEKLATVIKVRHPDWILQREGSQQCSFGDPDACEKPEKLAILIMQRCFEAGPPDKKNAVKLAELLQCYGSGKWSDFFKFFNGSLLTSELANPLCNALLLVPCDSYKKWDDKSGLFASRINDGLGQVAHDPKLARIYFFIFSELYYRLREQEPEFTSTVGGLFGRLNSVTKVVSTKEDKLLAARMLQNFLANEEFCSLDDSIEEYFARHQKSNLFAETQKDSLGKITAAIASWTDLNRKHRLGQQSGYC